VVRGIDHCLALFARPPDHAVDDVAIDYGVEIRRRGAGDAAPPLANPAPGDRDAADDAFDIPS
jgi:hypothetical protein